MHVLPSLFLRILLAVCVLAACLLSKTAHAQTAKRLALVIGNAAYTGTNPLKNPLNDANDMATSLQQAGFAVVKHTNLGRASMNRVIEGFMQRAEDADLVVVYYSGHGLQTGGETFLVPTDAKIQNERDIRSEAVRLGEFMEDLEAKRIKHTVLILDACRDNPFRARTRSSAMGLARPKEMNGAFLVAYATSDGATADDGEGRNGTYTAQLLRQLSTSKDKSIRDIMEETQLAVERVSRGVQRPKLYGDTAKFRDVYLPKAAAALGRPTGPDPAEREAWSTARKGASPRSYVEFLSDFPDGEFAASARTALLAFDATSITEATTAVRQRSNLPEVAATGIAAASAPAVAADAAALSALRPGQALKDCDVCPDLVVLPNGSFLMGDENGDSDEQPTRRVAIRSFAMGKFEVTQGQWQAVMGRNPSKFADCGENCPVDSVSWKDANEYLQRLSKRSGKTYRLPSESEWEYGARAGSTTRLYFGSDLAQMPKHAWFDENTESRPMPVGRLQANAFGLHDMYGNVWEWTQDCWHDSYKAAPTDGSAWSNYCGKENRVQRGGSWNDSASLLASPTRDAASDDSRFHATGFRVVRNLP